MPDKSQASLIRTTATFLVSLAGALRPQGDVPVRSAGPSRTLLMAADGPAHEAEALRFSSLFPEEGSGILFFRIG